MPTACGGGSTPTNDSLEWRQPEEAWGRRGQAQADAWWGDVVPHEPLPYRALKFCVQGLMFALLWENNCENPLMSHALPMTDPSTKSSPAPCWQSLCWLVLQMSVLGFLSFGPVWAINHVGVAGVPQFIFLAWKRGPRKLGKRVNIKIALKAQS